MKLRIVLVKISIVGLTLCTLSSATHMSCNTSIVRGDAYFNLMLYRDAIAWYKLDSTKSEAQWKIARAYVCYGDNASASEKEVNFRNAVVAAKKCIELEETNHNGHTWLAAALGNTAMYEGSSTKVKLCNQIKTELNRALVLNPNDDVAHSIMGSFYREVAHISWCERQLALAFIGRIPDGTYEDSEKSFKKSIALKSKIMRHWYELGLLYVYWGKDSEAIKAFNQAKSCQVLVSSDQKRLTKIDLYLKDLQ